MNAQSFLENFGHLANAPDGVKLLRELVFYFGITGGLSSQEVGDSDVTVIEEATLRAKQKYLEDNNVRRAQRKNAELRQTVASVPTWWTLIPAGDLVHLINGRAFKSSDWQTTGIPIIRIQNLNNPNASFNHYQGELADGHKVSSGDLLLSWSGTPGTSFGAFIWAGGDAALNQHIFKVIIYSELIDKEYLKMAINACLGALIGSARGGVGLKHVTKGQIEALQIPLPPLEEQKRIVSKVDDLMALCDKLEAQQRKRERRFPVLSRATHTRFAESPTPENLKAVFNGTTSVSPDDLRATIPALAFKGLLVDQDPTEGTGSELLEYSREKKQDLINDGVIKKEPWSSRLFDVQNPYTLPKNWLWARITDLVEKVTVGFVGSMKSHYVASGVPFLRTQNVRTNRFDPTGLVYINESFHASIEKSALQPGDVVVTRSGNVGVTCVIPATLPRANCSDLVVIKRPIGVQPRFLSYFINSLASAQIADNTVGIALTHYNTKSVAQMSIPLPPLEEQHRIVAKVDQLMALVDQLEQQKNKKSKVATAYAQAVVATITGTQTKDSEPMKVPKTELITKLEIGAKPKATDSALLTSLIAKSKDGLSAKALWQQSGLEIDAFYLQLKTEMASRWIVESERAVMQEVEAS